MENAFDDMSRPVATSHDEEPCTISVPEASELFSIAGLPRTERAIQRFCKKGELKCAFVETPFGSKYLIARSSIDRLIVQKQQAQKFAHDPIVREVSRPDATDRDLSRHTSDVSGVQEEPTVVIPQRDEHQNRHDNVDSDEERQDATDASNEKDNTIEKLRIEIFDLKVDNAGKQNFIRQLATDREQLMGEVKQISYQLGAAQTRVAQLEAPPKSTHDTPRHAATQVEDPNAADSGDPAQTPIAAEPPRPTPIPPTTEQPRRSIWKRIFR